VLSWNSWTDESWFQRWNSFFHCSWTVGVTAGIATVCLSCRRIDYAAGEFVSTNWWWSSETACPACRWIFWITGRTVAGRSDGTEQSARQGQGGSTPVSRPEDRRRRTSLSRKQQTSDKLPSNRVRVRELEYRKFSFRVCRSVKSSFIDFMLQYLLHFLSHRVAFNLV